MYQEWFGNRHVVSSALIFCLVFLTDCYYFKQIYNFAKNKLSQYQSAAEEAFSKFTGIMTFAANAKMNLCIYAVYFGKKYVESLLISFD